jgi:hypothetical protein
MQAIVWDRVCSSGRARIKIGGRLANDGAVDLSEAAGWPKCAVSECNGKCCPIKVCRRKNRSPQTLGAMHLSAPHTCVQTYLISEMLLYEEGIYTLVTMEPVLDPTCAPTDRALPSAA